MRGKKADGILLFLKAFSLKTDGKKRKIGKGNLYLTKVETKCGVTMADNHNRDVIKQNESEVVKFNSYFS